MWAATLKLVTTISRWGGRGGWFLPVLAIMWLVGASLFLATGLIDPFRLRFSWSHARLAAHPYPHEVVNQLINVVASDGTDLVVVGASTSIGYTPGMLREAFPEARQPFNLSFGCANADDYGVILSRLETSNTLKRVIVNLEVSLIKNCEHLDTVLRRYTNPRWYDPVPEFGVEGVKAALAVLTTNVLDLPSWRPREPDRVYYHSRAPLSKSPSDMKVLAEAVKFSRGWVTAGAPVSCEAIPSLETILLPHLRRLSARGVKVDLLFPPYALPFYALESLDNVNASKQFPGKGAVFANLVALRRCALRTFTDLPDARVHSFDDDFQITGDLSHYADVAHLRDYDVYKQILLRVASGSAVVTKDQWPAIEARLKKAVDEYQP